MIQFRCQHCEAKLQASEARAGREGRCPRCKGTTIIPPAPLPELQLVRDPEVSGTQDAPAALERGAFGPPEPRADTMRDRYERQREQEVLASLGPMPVPETRGERKLSWPIDILLYPATLTGLLTAGVLAILPFLYFLLPFGLITGRYFWGPVDLIGLYAIWYVAECIYDSARGGTRAPDVFQADTHLDELLSRFAYLLAVCALFLLPAVLYGVLARRMDAIFGALVAWAIFFFPMGLLAMVIHDSPSVLNPLFLLGSIFRVFLPYVGLVVFMSGLAALFWYVAHPPQPAAAPRIWPQVLQALVSGYAVLVLAHVLGRFYWRYRKRFDWGI